MMSSSSYSPRNTLARATRVLRRSDGTVTAVRAGAFLVTIEIACALLIGTELWHLQLNGTEIMQLSLLAVLSAAYGETCDRVERLRRYLSTDRGIAANQNAVLCFAGLLVLPTPGAVLLVVLVYAHNLIRVRRHRSTRIYREVFVTATVLLGTLVGCAVYHGLGGQLQNVGPRQALVIMLTLLTFSASSFVVLLAGIYVSVRPPTVRALLPPRDQVSYELATLLLGVLAGVIVLRTPWLSPILLVLAAMFHRSSLVRQLQSAATTDAKTGLLNFGAWRAAAVAELDRSVRAGTPAVALLIDLDHFKLINDQHGHLAGDATLVAVGHALTQELRGYDAVGRYGGEEFAAFLADVELDTAIAIAHRVRARIAALTPREGVRVTASIGIAEVAASSSLDELIGRADDALYEAKSAGRNRVRVSQHGAAAGPGSPVRRERADGPSSTR